MFRNSLTVKINSENKNKLKNKTEVFNFYIFVCLLCIGMPLPLHSQWRSQGDLQKSAVSLHLMGFKNQSPAIRFDNKCLYLLSHLSGSKKTFKVLLPIQLSPFKNVNQRCWLIHLKII